MAQSTWNSDRALQITAAAIKPEHKHEQFSGFGLLSVSILQGI